MNNLWPWAIYTYLRPEPQFSHLQYKVNSAYALELCLRFRDHMEVTFHMGPCEKQMTYSHVRFEEFSIGIAYQRAGRATGNRREKMQHSGASISGELLLPLGIKELGKGELPEHRGCRRGCLSCV